MEDKNLNLLATIEAHEESVWNISVHSKLPLLATCSSDRTSKIYDIRNLEDPRLVTVLDEQTHTKTIRTVSFKPSNEESYPTLALGSFDSTCSIWGADTYRSEWELLAVIEGHENEVKCIDWSQDGRYLATCARDKTIWIWETDSMNEEFECIAVLSEHEGDVKFVKWNDKGDDRMFASCSYDDTLRIWKQDDYDEDEWNCVALIRFETTVWGATWVDKDTIVCCLDDGQIEMYKKTIDQDVNNDLNAPSEGKLPNTIKKVEEWRVVKEFNVVSKVHEGTVYSVDSCEGRVVSCGSDGNVIIYEKGHDGEWVVVKQQKMCHGVSEINSVRFNGFNSVVSCGDDGSVKLWSI